MIASRVTTRLIFVIVSQLKFLPNDTFGIIQGIGEMAAAVMKVFLKRVSPAEHEEGGSLFENFSSVSVVSLDLVLVSRDSGDQSVNTMKIGTQFQV